MKLTPLLAALLATGPLALAQTPPAPSRSTLSPDEIAVWHVEQAWNQAYVNGDAGTLEEIEDPLYVDTEDSGIQHGRAEELAEAREHRMHITEMSLHEQAVRIVGDTAVVTGREVESGVGGNGPFSEILAETDTLVREGGRWRALASAETHLADGGESSIVPLWRDGGGWLKRHAGFVADARKGGVDLLFVGDSITDFWRTRGKAVWDKYYGNLHAANIGISGDRTQHVLWRLENGEVAGLRPKAIVLMIGTNNTLFERDGLTRRNTPAEAADGVKAVVADLRRLLPESKILLLAVFPRSHLPTDEARAEVAAINRQIAGLDDGDHVRYLDIGSKFLTSDGVLERDIMPDYLHPSAKGYEIWAQAIQEPLARLLNAP